MSRLSMLRMGALTVTTLALGLFTAAIADRLLTRWAYAVEKGRIQAATDDLETLDAEVATLEKVARGFRAVAKVARPGVVQIRVSGDRAEGMPSRHPEVMLGSGSGVIMDSDGYIMTNNHVISGEGRLRVRLVDDREFDAERIGTDPRTDIAVIKVNAPDLHPLKFGDSSRMEVGDWVVAVGAPFGLSQTVTHGIVSAVGRSNLSGVDIDYQDFIQSDAAINPGNSGGPLLNLRGEVIGINTAIASPNQTQNAGVAFSVPSNMAVRVAEQLRKSGSVVRGWLGVSFTAFPKDDAELFGVKDGRGAFIEAVLEDTPAAKAGIEVEDVIVGVNDKPIEDSEKLRTIFADLVPGEKTRLQVIRDRKPMDLTVTVGRQPAEGRLRAARADGVQWREVPQLPLYLRTLNQRAAERLKHDPAERGALIVGAPDDAGISNIEPGDVIVWCNGERIESVGDLRRAIESKPKARSVKLQVVSPSDDRREVIIELPEKSGR
ncbi:MAG: trypsin-like peptidase domain-containing protein [Phycisphaerales bacterium]|nr:trypsin-like peptidase domain-containing protein [Phycisphaerales bacterium]